MKLHNESNNKFMETFQSSIIAVHEFSIKFRATVHELLRKFRAEATWGELMNSIIMVVLINQVVPSFSYDQS